MKLETRCQTIEMILADVDGVLTDGGLIFNNEGIEVKRFHVRDGLGITLWQQAGYRFGLVTSRASHIVKVRAAELSIDIVRQGFAEKLPTVREITETCGLTLAQVAFVGDDLTDLAVLNSVGLGIAVADAVPEIRAAAQYVTTIEGGRGAVREAVELILKAKNRWEDLIRKYE